MSDIADVLADRQSVHGDFRDNARISQHLKLFFRAQNSWWELPEVQKEALDMIAAKICRILSGNSHHPDHWLDIAGYASLIVRDLEK